MYIYIYQCVYIYIYVCLDLMTLVYSRYSHLYTQEMFGIDSFHEMTIPWHGQGTGCCWEYFKAATLATRQVPGCTSGCVSRVFCAMCFFPIFWWKWRNGHVVNPIRNHPQHHHFSGLKSSPVMVGLWIPHYVLKLAELKPKNSFLIAICCKKNLGVGLRFQAPWELMSQTGPTQMGLLWYVWGWPQSLAKMVQITRVVQLGFMVIITYRDYGYVQ